MINKKGLLLVVSGPSGTGKGTICKDIVAKQPLEILGLVK